LKACIIFNPAARGRKAERFRDQLAALSASVTLKPTYAAGSGRELAAGAVQDGFDTIIAAGGDGTVNEVLNGLSDAPGGLAKVRFGLIPLGTVNVFARELGVPMDFAGTWQMMERGNEIRIDVPEVEFGAHGQAQRRCFAQLAGAGLDSRAIELVDWEQKKALGPLAYVVAGLKALAERKARLRVFGPNAELSGELVLIGNGRLYGGNFKLFPKASLRDGLLDVTVFPRVNWEVLLRSGWGWLTNQIHAAAGCHTFQAAAFRISSDAPVPFELDGENVGHLPATFSVRSGALRVIVP
jgi:diacylglycerol kinase (ATP)